MLKTKLPWVVVLMTVAATLVHGAITQRWAIFTPDTARADRMHGLKILIPDCEVSEIENDVPLKERSIATSRRYRPEDASYYAAVSIISGVPGAVSTHTPDVCYQSSGYRMLRAPKRESIRLSDGSQAEYFVADFEKKRATSIERLRIRWSWTTDGTWVAPDYARFHFIKAHELYKLYIMTPLPDSDQATEVDSGSVSRFVRTAFEQYAQAFHR